MPTGRVALHEQTDPVMIRAYHDGRKGATAFFRNRPFLDTLIQVLHEVSDQNCSILVHAASVGSEPYSLALWWLHKARNPSKPLRIYAADLDTAFLEAAERGVYPVDVLAGMTAEERGWFERCDEGVRVPERVRKMVTILPAMSFVDGEPGGAYDAVLVMNALTYVSAEQQAIAIRNISSYATHIIALTAFHPDSIGQDIEQAGFSPYLESQEQIHAAWGDRLSIQPIDPGSAEYSWRLPPFDSTLPDHEYRFCSIFVRRPMANDVRPELKKALDEMVQLAIQCHQQGDLAHAEKLYGKVLEFSPTEPAALHNLGLIYLGRNDLPAALLLLGEALKQSPGEATFNYNYALASQQQGGLQDALHFYAQAVKLRPSYREAWENQGVVLQDMERLDEAIDAYRQALKIDRCSRVANRNLGNVLRVVGRIEEALKHYQAAVDCGPLDSDIVFGYGATMLSTGDYANGWRLYEWRFWSPEFLERNPPYRVPLPRWDGTDLHGKHLLVYGEQGVGDEIMFASCLADVSSQASKVTVLCEPRLASLFARSFEHIHIQAKEKSEPSPGLLDSCQPDWCVALGSLPRHVRGSATSFPAKPYLFAEQQAVAAWRRRLDALGDTLKVGISWRGGTETRARAARSVELERLAPLFGRQDVTIVNIQYGEHGEEIAAFNRNASNPLVTFPDVDPLRDMDGFAALLSALDLVITVDNSTVHLAGALGVPAWLLLPAHADWRWMRGRNDTPWYSSVRLFWQKVPGSAAWDEVVARIGQELGRCVRGPKSCGEPVPEWSAAAIDRFLPTLDLKPVAFLLNDTSYWYHWGCTATSLALHEGLRARGYLVDSAPITVFNSLVPSPGSLADFDDESFFQRFCMANSHLVDRIKASDVVLINGEGTLHGVGKTALALLYTAYSAKRWLGKNTQIVNHSCYPDGQDAAGSELANAIYRKVYEVLDFVAVREAVSAQELSRIGIKAQASFDCLPLYVMRHAPTPNLLGKRVVMAGSVLLTGKLLEMMVHLACSVIDQGYEVQVLVGANSYLAADDVLFVNEFHKQLRGRYTLVAAHSESEWLGTIAGASLLISGRFHHTIAAACVGTPLVVASSNTSKIEGLLNRLGLSPDDVWLNPDQVPQAVGKVRRLMGDSSCARLTEQAITSLRESANCNFFGLPLLRKL